MIGDCYKNYWWAVFSFILGVVGFITLIILTFGFGYGDLALWLTFGFGVYLLSCIHFFTHYENPTAYKAHIKAVRYYDDWIHRINKE